MRASEVYPETLILLVDRFSQGWRLAQWIVSRSLILSYAFALALIYYTQFNPTCSPKSTMTEEMVFKFRYWFVLSKANAYLSPRSLKDKIIMICFDSIEVEFWAGFWYWPCEYRLRWFWRKLCFWSTMLCYFLMKVQCFDTFLVSIIYFPRRYLWTYCFRRFRARVILGLFLYPNSSSLWWLIIISSWFRALLFLRGLGWNNKVDVLMTFFC